MIYRFISIIFLIFLFVDLNSQNYKIFKSNGNKGLISYEDTIIKAEYDDVIYLGGCDWSYFAVKKNGKYAIWNYNSEKLDFKFDFVYPMSDYFGKNYSNEASAVAVVDNKVGLIDISSCQYGVDFSIKANYLTFYISDVFYKEEGFYILKAEINNDCSDFFLVYEYFQSPKQLSHLKGVKEIYPIKSENIYDDNVFIIEKKSKFGIANQSEIVLSTDYESVELLNTSKGSDYDEIEMVNINKYLLFELTKNDKKNVFSYSLNKILYPKFYSKIKHFNNGGILLSSVYEEGKYYVFMDAFPMDTIEPVSTLFLYNLYFDDFELIDNRYAFVKLGDKWAMVNEFDFLTDFSFNKPSKWKFKIKRAQEKWKSKYKNQLNSEDSLYYKENGKYGLQATFFTPAIFDTIFEYNNSLIIKYNDVYGLYNHGNFHMFNIHRFEFADDKSNPLIKAFYENRFKYINSIDNSFFNSIFYDAILQIDNDNFLGFYNGKIGGYSTSYYKEIPPIFDSIFLPWNDGKMKIAFSDSFISPIYEYNYTSNSMVFNEFQQDEDLKDFIYLRDSSNWTFKYQRLNFYSDTFETVAEIKAKYILPIVNWNEEKKSAGFELEELDRNLILLKKENKSQVYYFSYTDFFRNIDNHKYLIYTGNADSIVLKSSYILVYNNGLFKPLKIESESEFNDNKMFFKTYKTNGLISYYIDKNQNKYFFFKNKFYEFDKFELLENGFTIFEKGEKYAVLDDTRTYFSDFKFEDVSIDGSTIMEFAFKQNGKWGLMKSSFDYESMRSSFEVKLEPIYETAEEVLKNK